MDRPGQRSRRARRDSGASAVEYGLIIAGAGVVLVALSFATGKAVSGAFLTNATAVGGPSGSVGIAQLGGVVANPSTSSAAPTTTSAAPTTTSAAPVTTSAAPVTTSAAPVTTSAAPVTTSAAPTTSPTPTRPADAIDVSRNGRSRQDVGADKDSFSLTATVTPSTAGTTIWDNNGRLTFDPASGIATPSLVTVSYSYTDRVGGKDITTTGTLTFWVV
jgi:Flp pilus assembly pilin Flp